MQDELTRWDETLASLEAAVRVDDRARALEQFIAFDGELARYVRDEERVLFTMLERFDVVSCRATASMRFEHRSLRRLVDEIGALIAVGDRARSLDVLASLRSVLLVHVTKEEWVLHPLVRPVASC